MALNKKRNPNPVKGFFASLIAGGATVLGYSLLFPFLSLESLPDWRRAGVAHRPGGLYHVLGP